MMWRISTSARAPRLALGLAGLGMGLLTVACADPGSDRPDDDGAAEDGIDVPDPVDPEQADPGEYLKGIEAEFKAAASEFDVPIDVLKAVGYVESQWQMVSGVVEFDGIDPAFG